ncbi:MAG: hypothetical protein NVS9B1_00400 [Candidatus Dormibacteraceae bacterium]
MLTGALDDPGPDLRLVNEAEQDRRPSQSWRHQFQVIARRRRVDGSAAEEEAAEERLAVARFARQGASRRLQEGSLQGRRQRDLNEESRPFGAADGVILGLDLRQRPREPDDLAGDCVAEKREVGGVTVAGLDQPAPGREKDAVELGQLAARSGRYQSGQFAFDLRRE